MLLRIYLQGLLPLFAGLSIALVGISNSAYTDEADYVMAIALPVGVYHLTWIALLIFVALKKRKEKAK